MPWKITTVTMSVSTRGDSAYIIFHTQEDVMIGKREGMLDTVTRYMRDRDFRFVVTPELSMVLFRMVGKNGQWTCYGIAREKERQFALYSKLDFKVPPDTRSSVAEFLTLANYAMIIGNFEMDMRDGEVRFKTSIDVDDGKLTWGMLDSLFGINFAMFDKYLDALSDVALAAKSPLRAIEEADERANEEED